MLHWIRRRFRRRQPTPEVTIEWWEQGLDGRWTHRAVDTALHVYVQGIPLAGGISEYAVFARILPAERIEAHYQAGVAASRPSELLASAMRKSSKTCAAWRRVEDGPITRFVHDPIDSDGIHICAAPGWSWATGVTADDVNRPGFGTP